MTATVDAVPDATTPPESSCQHEFLFLSQHLPARKPGADDHDRVDLLRPVVTARRGGWVGSPVCADATPLPAKDYSPHPIPLSATEVTDHLLGQCQMSIATTYHDAIAPPTFDARWHAAYREVNRRFTAAAADLAAMGGAVLVYGHHLQLVPAALRARRPDLLIGFFLDIPFPPMELFRRLPMREHLLAGVLGADVVGLQSRRSADNFRRVAVAHDSVRLGQDGVTMAGRPITIGSFPQTVDTATLRNLAAAPGSQARAAAVRAGLGGPERIVLAVDDLDPAAGIEQHLTAYERLLDGGDVDPDRTAFVQVVNPDPYDGPRSRALRDGIERTVGRLNGRHGRVGRPALHYVHRRLDPHDLVAMYTAADVLVAAPLRAGMSGPAAEYAATRTDNSGAVVLSEFSGSAEELTGAFLVNPYDVDAQRSTLLRALDAPPTDLRRRMAALRRRVATSDVHRWAGSVLAALGQSAVRRA
jgi:trehalose 6-phosphate synthase